MVPEKMRNILIIGAFFQLLLFSDLIFAAQAAKNVPPPKDPFSQMYNVTINPSPPPPPTQVMSQDTFANTTSKMAQETQSGYEQKLKQQLTNQPPPPAETSPSVDKTKEKDNAETNTEDTGSQHKSSSGNQKSRLKPADDNTSVMNNGGSKRSTQESNTYTGFSSPSAPASGTNTNSGSGSSGRWNINY